MHSFLIIYIILLLHYHRCVKFFLKKLMKLLKVKGWWYPRFILEKCQDGNDKGWPWNPYLFLSLYSFPFFERIIYCREIQSIVTNLLRDKILDVIYILIRETRIWNLIRGWKGAMLLSDTIIVCVARNVTGLAHAFLWIVAKSSGLPQTKCNKSNASLSMHPTGASFDSGHTVSWRGDINIRFLFLSFFSGGKIGR